MAKRKIAPVHPGEILREDYLKPLGVSAYRLAKDIGVPATRVGEVLRGRRGVTAETAIRLAAYFGTDAQSWMNLQAQYDLECARDALTKTVARIPRCPALAA